MKETHQYICWFPDIKTATIQANEIEAFKDNSIKILSIIDDYGLLIVESKEELIKEVCDLIGWEFTLNTLTSLDPK